MSIARKGNTLLYAGLRFKPRHPHLFTLKSEFYALDLKKTLYFQKIIHVISRMV
jgi:hypothetical protein